VQPKTRYRLHQSVQLDPFAAHFLAEDRQKDAGQEQPHQQDQDLQAEHLTVAGDLDDAIHFGVHRAQPGDAGHAQPAPGQQCQKVRLADGGLKLLGHGLKRLRHAGVGSGRRHHAHGVLQRGQGVADDGGHRELGSQPQEQVERDRHNDDPYPAGNGAKPFGQRIDDVQRFGNLR